MYAIKSPPVIFLHVPKTGGKSVVEALRIATGREKVVGPKDHLFNPYKPEEEINAAHCSASELSWQLGKENYKRSLVFSVVRNPLDWAVSFYYYGRNKMKPDPFGSYRAFMEWMTNPNIKDIPGGFHPDGDSWLLAKRGQIWYYDDRVDYLIDFDRLEEGTQLIFNRLGLQWDGLPLINKSRRPKAKYAGIASNKRAQFEYEFSRDYRLWNEVKNCDKAIKLTTNQTPFRYRFS